MEKGYYDFLGRTVEYNGGYFGYDLDNNRERISVRLLKMMGKYIGEEIEE